MFGTEWLMISIISGTVLGGTIGIGLWSWFDNKKEEKKYAIIDDYDIYDGPNKYQKYAE